METLFNENTKAIAKIKPSDYGLDENKATELIKNLPQITAERDVFVSQFDEVIKMDIELPETARKARELRLRIRDNRTKGIEAWHKTTKDFFLKGGQFVDAIKRMEIAVNERMESDLEKIEKYQENLEIERKARLKAERTVLIQPFVEDVNTYMLGEMTENAFQTLLAGAKAQYEEKKAIAEKAEADRIAKEKADADERERIRLDNIRLQKEAEERERQMNAEREKARKEREKKDALLKKEREKAEADRKSLEEKVRKEKEASDKIIADQKAKAEKERKEKEQLQEQIRAKKEADEKRIADEKKRVAAEEKKAKLAPDKTKLLNFMQAINDLPRPEVKSIEAASIASNANTLLVKVANYIKENADKL